MDGWKHIAVPFGGGALDVRVPPNCVRLRMKESLPLTDARAAIQASLASPIGTPPLEEIIRAKSKPVDQLSVCITVSDITRPVPYKGEDGLLAPLLAHVEGAGMPKDRIVILVGNGMHRASTQEEKMRMFGPEIVEQYRIADHNCEDLDSQVFAAETANGTRVFINGLFHGADVRIVTGLVESHFMAGVSGGRKGICPALVNTQTIKNFHGPEFLEHPNAANLILDGNPCHEESLEVARTVGVDFLVNVTLDRNLRLTGCYAGDLEAAHLAAVEAIKDCVAIPIPDPFDIVLTHGGYVGRNHYQCAKAAVGAIPAVKENGIIALLADNSDEEPVGGPEYKTLLHLLKLLGPDRYVSILRHPDWLFTKDQWEPEMWAKPLRKAGVDGFFYCAPQLNERDFQIIPGVGGHTFIAPSTHFQSKEDKAQHMFQNAINAATQHPRFESRTPTFAFIEEGPYAVPTAQQ